MTGTTVGSIEEFISAVKAESYTWPLVWFRGEPASKSPLVPKLYRPRADGRTLNENKILQLFRVKAPALANGRYPDRKATDQWLFLAQHFGVPTRLLDWTEGALIGLHFALGSPDPVVWMLNPIELNQLSVTDTAPPPAAELPLTWFHPANGINIGSINVRGAWEQDTVGVQLPVAVQSTNIHLRMAAQRSCFTIQGTDKRSLTLLKPHLVRRFEVASAAREAMRRDLRMLGITESGVFPDLQGLASELQQMCLTETGAV